MFQNANRNQTLCTSSGKRSMSVSKMFPTTSHRDSELQESYNMHDSNNHIICKVLQNFNTIVIPLEKSINTNRCYKLRLKYLNQKNYGHINTDNAYDSNNHIICKDLQNFNNIVVPLEKSINTNRCYKLRLKHLNQEKYGHLNTDNAHKRRKPQEEIPNRRRVETLVMSSPNRSFQVKLRNINLASSNDPKYKFYFNPKSSVPRSRIRGCSNSTANKENINCDDMKHRAKKSQPITNVEMHKTKVTSTPAFIKLINLDTHCFLCSLGKNNKEKPQLVYCKNFCAQCELSGNKPSSEENKATSSKSSNTRMRGKLPSRIAKPIKKRQIPKNISTLLDNTIENEFRDKVDTQRFTGNCIDDCRNSVLNENCIQEAQSVAGSLQLLQTSMGNLGIKCNNGYDGDSEFDETFRLIRSSNTVEIIESVERDCGPLKQELADLHRYVQKFNR